MNNLIINCVLHSKYNCAHCTRLKRTQKYQRNRSASPGPRRRLPSTQSQVCYEQSTLSKSPSVPNLSKVTSERLNVLSKPRKPPALLTPTGGSSSLFLNSPSQPVPPQFKAKKLPGSTWKNPPLLSRSHVRFNTSSHPIHSSSNLETDILDYFEAKKSTSQAVQSDSDLTESDFTESESEPESEISEPVVKKDESTNLNTKEIAPTEPVSVPPPIESAPTEPVSVPPPVESAPTESVSVPPPVETTVNESVNTAPTTDDVVLLDTVPPDTLIDTPTPEAQVPIATDDIVPDIVPLVETLTNSSPPDIDNKPPLESDTKPETECAVESLESQIQIEPLQSDSQPPNPSPEQGDDVNQEVTTENIEESKETKNNNKFRTTAKTVSAFSKGKPSEAKQQSNNKFRKAGKAVAAEMNFLNSVKDVAGKVDFDQVKDVAMGAKGVYDDYKNPDDGPKEGEEPPSEAPPERSSSPPPGENDGRERRSREGRREGRRQGRRTPERERPLHPPFGSRKEVTRPASQGPMMNGHGDMDGPRKNRRRSQSPPLLPRRRQENGGRDRSEGGPNNVRRDGSARGPRDGSAGGQRNNSQNRADLDLDWRKKEEAPEVDVAARTADPGEPVKSAERIKKNKKGEKLTRQKDIKWTVSVWTSNRSGAGTDANVYLVAYGKGPDDQSKKSEKIFLQNDGDCFETGEKDQFRIETVDIGKLYKIRIGHDKAGWSPAWHLEKVEMENLNTKRKSVFKCGRWLAKDESQGPIMLEMPVQAEDTKKTLPLINYVVKVHTGKKMGASTDANVFIAIFGEQGDTGERPLIRSKTSSNKFEKGSIDEFIIEAVTLLQLEKIIIRHDGSKPGAGWFLEKVSVKAGQASGPPVVFKCGRWLDCKEDDGMIVREIYALGSGQNSVDAQNPDMLVASKIRDGSVSRDVKGGGKGGKQQGPQPGAKCGNCKDLWALVENLRAENEELKAKLQKLGKPGQVGPNGKMGGIPRNGKVAENIAQKHQMRPIGKGVYIHREDLQQALTRADDGKAMVKILTKLCFTQAELMDSSEPLDQEIKTAIIEWVMKQKKCSSSRGDLQYCISQLRGQQGGMAGTLKKRASSANRLNIF